MTTEGISDRKMNSTPRISFHLTWLPVWAWSLQIGKWQEIRSGGAVHYLPAGEEKEGMWERSKFVEDEI